MQLCKAVIASIFGRGSRAPLRTGLLVLCALWVASGTLGLWFAAQVPSIPLLQTHPLYFMAASVYALQVVVLFVLLGAYSVLRPTNDTLARLLSLLPLRRSILWTLLVLPGIILAWITLWLIAPITITIFRDAGLPWWSAVMCIVIGTANALG